MADSIPHQAVASETFDRISLLPTPKPDRLPPMLFLAALIHGILIIGITFNAAIDDYFSDAVSLEVTIVADPERSFDRLDDAMYLAQASQEGSGNTEEQARPSAPLESNVPIDNIGAEDGNALRDANVQDQSSDEVLATRSARDESVVNDPRMRENTRAARALAMESGAETTLPLPRDASANFLVRDKNRRQIVVSADTRESNIAGYVDRWKRKIETVGQRYLPEEIALEGLTGSPTLEVTIDATGELAEVVIRRSSGSAILDQAALNILERASPFEPFPEAVRLDHPELNFLYKWRFSPSRTTSAARLR
jgi:protein TonB